MILGGDLIQLILAEAVFDEILEIRAILRTIPQKALIRIASATVENQ